MDQYGVQQELEELEKILGGIDTLGLVIRGHIYLEQVLKQFLELAHPRDAKNLHGFANHIDLALASGLKAQYKAPLQNINRLRNKFAHQLDTELSRAAVTSLYQSFSDEDSKVVDELFTNLKATFGWPHECFGDLDPKDAFSFLVITLWAILRAAAIRAHPGYRPEPGPALIQITEPLISLYQEADEIRRLNDDLDYLCCAYRRIEAWWQKNFEAMIDIKLVILSEAPLFGDTESYIYNPDSKLTNFLYPKNLSLISFRNSLRTKTDLLIALRELGILILDIFPYAFNTNNTPFSYRKLGKTAKKKLLEASSGFHLRPKLQAIRERSNATHYCARYAVVSDILETVTPECLDNPEFRPSTLPIISMQGGTIDKDKLKRVYDDG